METGERTGPAEARGICTRRPGGRGWRGPEGFQGAIRVSSLVAEGPFQASVYLVAPWRCNLSRGIPKELKAGVPHSSTTPAYTRPASCRLPTRVPARGIVPPAISVPFSSQAPDKCSA